MDLDVSPRIEELDDDCQDSSEGPFTRAVAKRRLAAQSKYNSTPGARTHNGRIVKPRTRSYAHNVVSENARAHFGDVVILFDGQNATQVTSSTVTLRQKMYLLCALLAEIACEIPLAVREFLFSSRLIPRSMPGVFAILFCTSFDTEPRPPILVDLGSIQNWKTLSEFLERTPSFPDQVTADFLAWWEEWLSIGSLPLDSEFTDFVAPGKVYHLKFEPTQLYCYVCLRTTWRDVELDRRDQKSRGHYRRRVRGIHDSVPEGRFLGLVITEFHGHADATSWGHRELDQELEREQQNGHDEDLYFLQS